MKNLELQFELKTFNDRDGKKVSYVNYFVEINGIKVTLKPSDGTAKQLLGVYYEQN